jgi:hypothetical protein
MIYYILLLCCFVFGVLNPSMIDHPIMLLILTGLIAKMIYSYLLADTQEVFDSEELHQPRAASKLDDNGVLQHSPDFGVDFYDTLELMLWKHKFTHGFVKDHDIFYFAQNREIPVQSSHFSFFDFHKKAKWIFVDSDIRVSFKLTELYTPHFSFSKRAIFNVLNQQNELVFQLLHQSGLFTQTSSFLLKNDIKYAEVTYSFLSKHGFRVFKILNHLGQEELEVEIPFLADWRSHFYIKNRDGLIVAILQKQSYWDDEFPLRQYLISFSAATPAQKKLILLFVFALSFVYSPTELSTSD